MSLSKEHVLVLGTLAILTLLHLSRGDAGPVKRVRPGAAPPHDVPELPPDIFAGPGEAFDLERNRFLRPSDTVPLPLLKYPELPIPEDPPLPVLAPPIRPGPGLAHWYLNRIDARKLDLENAPAAAGKAEGEAVSPNGGNPAPGQEQGGEGGERQGPGNENHGLTYDRIFLDKGGPKWGYVQGKGELKYLHGTPDPKELLACVAPFREDVQFRIINVDKETQVMTLSYKPQSVTRIVFANNIHNRIQMDLRRVPSGTAGLSNLEALIRKWISEEQDHIEALQAAEEQADRYIRTASDDPKGYELKAEVFATTHQFEKELALYQELMEGELGDRPFVLRGLGRLEEKLGMHKAAEGHLRAAIAQDPSDIASRLAHSQFLLGRGRIEEALAAARAAANLLIATTRPARSLAVYSQLVACLLAAGRPSEAETERLHAENLGVESPYLAYLEGAVRSAEGKYAEAKDAFQAAGVGLPSFAEPLIGEALCTVRMGGPEALPAAIQSLESVAERDPLERHRALSGEAFVHHLAGRSQDAQILAREARNLAPDDPYVLYLLGRLLARAESWEEADEILEKNLERHPLLIEAMAEMAWLELQRAKHLPEGAYEFLEKGERFARKACQVEASRARLWVYQDLLGTIRYLLTDYEGARKAFQTSLDWGGGNHSKIMLALIKYRKGRVQNAVEDLQDLSEGIRDKTDPHKNFVLEVKRQIEDHLGKRLFKDSFQKPRFGKNWKVVSKHRKVKWRTGKGRAGVIGTSTDEKNELYLRYTLDRSGDFVSVEFDLEVGPAHRGSTAVMRISDRNARGSQSFELRVGFERGSRLYFREGRVATAKKPLFDMHDEDFPEDLRLKRGDEPITIKVELVRVPGKRSQGEVVVTFGGTELGRVPVKRWPAVDQRPTFFDFIVRGQRGSKLDAHLHGFRLIRKD